MTLRHVEIAVPVVLRPITLLCMLANLCGCGRIGFDLLSSSSSTTVDAGQEQPMDAAMRDGSASSMPDASADGGTSLHDGGAPLGDGGRALDGGGEPPDAGPDADGGTRDDSLRIATLPYADSDAIWSRITAAAPAVAVAVLNPESGPGSTLDSSFLARVRAAQDAGILVLGYVPTSYAQRASSAIEADIDGYESMYGVDGFFLDQVPNTCADQPYYQALFDTIKAQDATATVVLDPGIVVPECYVAAADILVTFQDTAARYETFNPSGWEASYPKQRFWHLVHDAANVAALNRVFDLAESRHVGFMYVTPDVQPDPWNTLPGATYWSAELERASP